MQDCSDAEESKKWYVFHKGRCMNNLLMWCAWGVVCNYSIGWCGATHDSHAARSLFEDLQSYLLNPHRIGAFVDSAFKAFCCSGMTKDGRPDGRTPVLRPLTTESVEALLQEYFKAVSRLVTVMRQHNEWGNGGGCICSNESSQHYYRIWATSHVPRLLV